MEREPVPAPAGTTRTISLPAEPASAGAARRLVREVIADSGPESVEDAAMLCVSELVANVSLHVGAGECQVTVAADPGGVTVEVTDDSPASPVVGLSPVGAESGRGLHIVEALSCAWGVRRRTPRGKTVWVRLRPEDRGQCTRTLRNCQGSSASTSEGNSSERADNGVQSV